MTEPPQNAIDQIPDLTSGSVSIVLTGEALDLVADLAGPLGVSTPTEVVTKALSFLKSARGYRVQLVGSDGRPRSINLWQ